MTQTEVLGNVIVFGETSAGKSSIINMIAGTQLAVQTPNGMTGCTFKHHSYILPVHVLSCTQVSDTFREVKPTQVLQ
jgi:ABC-type molybdate transport system ATPase subunit